jgi:hypothetical protein
MFLRAPILSIVLFFSVVLVIGCTFSTTRGKAPVYAISTDQIQNNLDSLIKYESISLEGKIVTTNGEAHSELDISITNGTNIPVDGSAESKLGRSVSRIVRNSLRDTAEYEKFVVTFVKSETNGSITRRSWKSYPFKKEEL